MPRYFVTSEVTISLSAEVEAEDEAHAVKKAGMLDVPAIEQEPEDPEEPRWATSGELDGEPQNVKVEHVVKQ